MGTNFPQYQQAVGATAPQPLTPDPTTQMPPDAMAQLQAQYDALQRQIEARGHQQVDPEQVQRAQAQNNLDQQFGMLMQLTGDEGASNIGASVLKQAMAKRTPTVTERGAYNPMTQRWDYNPEYLNEKDQSQQAQLSSRMSSMQEARARDKAERDWRAHEAELNRQGRAENARTMADAKATNRDYDPIGRTSDGKPVVTDKKSSINYLVALGPDGTPTYTPYGGEVIPTATFEKNVAAVTQAAGSAAQAARTAKEVEQNPNAFGTRAAIVSGLPAALQAYAAPLVGLTAQDTETRANLLRRTAMETNEIYGAAQSAGEMARAAAFQPLPTDTPEQIFAKNSAARAWYREKANALGPAAVKAALQRSPGLAEGMEAPPGAPGAPGAAKPDPLGIFGPGG